MVHRVLVLAQPVHHHPRLAGSLRGNGGFGDPGGGGGAGPTPARPILVERRFFSTPPFPRHQYW